MYEAFPGVKMVNDQNGFGVESIVEHFSLIVVKLRMLINAGQITLDQHITINIYKQNDAAIIN